LENVEGREDTSQEEYKNIFYFFWVLTGVRKGRRKGWITRAKRIPHPLRVYQSRKSWENKRLVPPVITNKFIEIFPSYYVTLTSRSNIISIILIDY